MGSIGMADDRTVVDGDAAASTTTAIATTVTETMAPVEETSVTTTATPTLATAQETTSVAGTSELVDATAEENAKKQSDSTDEAEQQQALDQDGAVVMMEVETSADIQANKDENVEAEAAAESSGEPADSSVSDAMEVNQERKSDATAERMQEEKHADVSTEQDAFVAAVQPEASAVEPESAAGKRKEIESLAADTVQGATPKKQKTEASKSVKVETPVPAPALAPAPPVQQSQSNDKAPDAVASAAPPAPIMISRDDMAKMEEDGGLVKFDVITNDGTPEHMVQLTTLKNIFAKQLPKMPKEYIVRLVFDRNHRSMVILKNGTHVIGGICYRPFLPNHFAEIAFCAINAADQVKGYGTRLMNHLKEFVKQEGITHFLTYADNYAIGYFKKQGFAKVVSMPRPNWFGYIKDYDGGTLMECTIHYQINYLRITSMVHKQRKVCDRQAGLYRNCRVGKWIYFI